jgi:methionyl-tRNA formyltransferase
MELRIIFMGTAELACSSLRALVAQKEWVVVSVVTQPDRPKGRNLALQFSPVKKTALAANIPVLQPERAKEAAFLAELTRLQPDLIVVAAYGQILPKTILELPRLGCLNVHTSLLPKFRGAAPIQWAILEDEQETGVTIMRMDAGLDTGDILTQAATRIVPEDNAETLHNRLAEMGADLLVRTVPDLVSGRIIPRPQPPEGATYARKISREDGRLDWNQPARTLWNKVRAFTPWPGAYTHFGSAADLLKIWECAVAEHVSGAAGQIVQADKNGLVLGCGQGGLRLLEVQKEGGRRMSTQEFLAGHALKPGSFFS